LDGTLADTLSDIGGAMNEVLAARGLRTHPLPSYRRLIGNGALNLARRAAPDVSPELWETLSAEFRTLYSRAWVTHAVPYPGAEQLLRDLHARGFKLAVLSNKADVGTRAVVKALFEGHPFERIFGEREGIPRKPHPQAALEIAESLGVAPSECVYVGDSEVDVETSQRAGMRNISVLWGFRTQEELTSAGAATLVETPGEILAVLDDWTLRED
jgi:phosphoglycolate phosphatase